jgi:hypothetical protein
MQWRGPDIAFVLYSYTIFALMAEDEDISDIRPMLERARQAEVYRAEIFRQKYHKYQVINTTTKVQEGKEKIFSYGKVFDLAHVGFFRYNAQTQNNAFAWEALAICRFLVYNDFNSSFDYFLQAFHHDAKNIKIFRNYTIMMTHFHGPDKYHHEEIRKQRMQHHAHKDAEIEEMRRLFRENAKLRQKSAIKIQVSDMMII